MEMHMVHMSNHLRNKSATKDEVPAGLAVLGFFFKVPTAFCASVRSSVCVFKSTNQIGEKIFFVN
jgi:hypothetical protein